MVPYRELCLSVAFSAHLMSKDMVTHPETWIHKTRFVSPHGIAPLPLCIVLREDQSQELLGKPLFLWKHPTASP